MNGEWSRRGAAPLSIAHPVAVASVSGTIPVVALGVRGTADAVGATGLIDIIGQKIQGGEYRAGQTVLAMQTALTFAPLASSSLL